MLKNSISNIHYQKMDITLLADFIQEVGFPIAVAVILLIDRLTLTVNLIKSNQTLITAINKLIDRLG